MVYVVKYIFELTVIHCLGYGFIYGVAFYTLSIQPPPKKNTRTPAPTKKNNKTKTKTSKTNTEWNYITAMISYIISYLTCKKY